MKRVLLLYTFRAKLAIDVSEITFYAAVSVL